jgi:hypothetical protein
MKALLLLAALAAPSNSASTRFDVLCTGTKQTVSGSTEPYQEEFRVDLAAKHYCGGACDDLTNIASVNDHYIILTDVDDPKIGQIFTTIDRRTGDYSERISAFGQSLGTKATCERRPFKGFPAHRRKF